MKNLNNLKANCIDERFENLYYLFKRDIIFKNWKKCFQKILLEENTVLMIIAISPKNKMLAYTILDDTIENQLCFISKNRIVDINKKYGIKINVQKENTIRII